MLHPVGGTKGHKLALPFKIVAFQCLPSHAGAWPDWTVDTVCSCGSAMTEKALDYPVWYGVLPKVTEYRVHIGVTWRRLS